MKRLYILSIFISLFLSISAQSPKYETRAVWLTTIGGLDWPRSYASSSTSIASQQQELCRLLDLYQQAGINTVLLQTRIRGTVIYPSAYEPWDGCLSGVPGRSPGYDALQFAISECHRRGMELHAWVVTIPVGKWNATGCQRLRKKFPKLIKKIGDEGYMNPEDSQTGSYLADMCEEIVRRYDVDGIHLDYIRYPETWNQLKGKRVAADRKRQYITDIVRSISTRVKQIKPWVRMSCSPIGKRDDLSRFSSRGWNAYSAVSQDVEMWMESGLMDMIFPMMYFRDNQFDPFAIDWKERSHGKIVAPGLGIYQLSPKERNWPLSTIRQQMNLLRSYGMGHTYFRGRFLTDNIKGVYNFVAHEFDVQPALVEPMTWLSATAPKKPSGLRVEHLVSDEKGDITHIAWTDNNPGNTYYNIYSSREWPVDTRKADHLIAVRRQDCALTLSRWEPGRYYAVTCTDRYGNESEPLQQEAPVRATLPVASPITIADKTVQLPDLHSQLDARFVVIETQQGGIIAVKPYPANGLLNIADIPEGMYILRSLNRKGITHRIGFLSKRSFIEQKG